MDSSARKHKLLVMQQLPGKMSTLVTPDILSTLVQIWNVSLCVHVHTVHIIHIDHNYFYRIFWPCTRSYQVRIPPQPKWVSFSKYVFMHILTHTRAHTHTHTNMYMYTHMHLYMYNVFIGHFLATKDFTRQITSKHSVCVINLKMKGGHRLRKYTRVPK